MIKYYLGIDGGGTKTLFLLADGNGKIIRSVKKGASNPVDLGIDACIAVLKAVSTKLPTVYVLAKYRFS